MFGWPANIMSYTWIDWRHLKFHLGLIYGSPLGVQKRKSFHLMTMKRINIRVPGVSAQTLAFFPLFFNFFITPSRCWMKSCVRSSSKSSFPGFQKEYVIGLISSSSITNNNLIFIDRASIKQIPHSSKTAVRWGSGFEFGMAPNKPQQQEQKRFYNPYIYVCALIINWILNWTPNPWPLWRWKWFHL